MPSAKIIPLRTKIDEVEHDENDNREEVILGDMTSLVVREQADSVLLFVYYCYYSVQ